MLFKSSKIKSQHLLLAILFIICTYNKVIDFSSAPQKFSFSPPMNFSPLVITNPGIDTTTCNQFKLKNNKKYLSQSEDLYRCMVFQNNKKKINDHNGKKQRKYNQALNQFADLTAQEFSLIYTNTFPSNQIVRNYANSYIQMEQQTSFLQNFQLTGNYDTFPSLNKTQLNQILDLVAKEVQRKNSYIQNSSDTTQGSLINLGKNFKKNQSQNFPKNLVYPDQILNIEKSLNTFVTNFVQRFQNLTSDTNGQNTKKKQVYSFLMQNKNTILSALNMSDSLIISTLNSTDNALTQLQLSQQFDNILFKIFGKNQLTSPAPLQQIYNPILSARLLQQSSSTQNSSLKTLSSSTISIDWTMHAGGVRYQGICGACYTFASSDAVASLYSIYKYGFFVPLSTQQVIDCSSNGLTYGCSGGFLQGSFAYMQARGITTDYSYPYVSSSNGIAGSCKFQGGNFKVSLFKSVAEGSCSALIQQLKYGPVSVGVAGYRLQFYSSGIFNDCNSYIDHAVVLIGYKSGVGWKIKNSWGSTWGINGFGWIADGNNCAICDMAVAPKL